MFFESTYHETASIDLWLSNGIGLISDNFQCDYKVRRKSICLTVASYKFVFQKDVGSVSTHC